MLSQLAAHQQQLTFGTYKQDIAYGEFAQSQLVRLPKDSHGVRFAHTEKPKPSTVAEEKYTGIFNAGRSPSYLHVPIFYI